MQVAERGQPLADGAHSLASRACSWGKTYPLVFYKYGGSLVDFIIQFQSKILREKRREKEREKERVPAKGKADCGGVVFRRLIVWELTPVKNGRSRQGEEHGEPRRGSQGM